MPGLLSYNDASLILASGNATSISFLGCDLEYFVIIEAFALSLTYQFMVCFEVFKKHFTPHFRANLSSCESIVSYI